MTDLPTDWVDNAGRRVDADFLNQLGDTVNGLVGGGRVVSIASSATPTIDVTATDVYDITALATNITSLSTTGTPRAWQPLWVSIHAAAGRTVAWNPVNFADSGAAAWPTAIPAGATVTAAGRYVPAEGKFICFAVDDDGY